MPHRLHVCHNQKTLCNLSKALLPANTHLASVQYVCFKCYTAGGAGCKKRPGELSLSNPTVSSKHFLQDPDQS